MVPVLGRGRRGFVLPTTLLVLALLTVMLTAAFVLVSAEHRASENAFASTRALALAQAGLQTYLSRPSSLTPSSTSDSTRRTYATGYVDIVSRVVVPAAPGRLALWVVRADGYVTGGTLAGTPRAKRSVAVIAEFNPGVLPIRAAMVAVNGVRYLGTGTIPLSGLDASFCAPLQDTTALTLTAPYSDSSTGSTPPDPPGGGSGPAVEGPWPTSRVFDSTHVDWSRVLAGDFTPDYVTTPPCLHSMQLSGYPVGRCDGNATLSGTRRGLLVVTGNLQLADGVHWDGVLVVGGRITTPTGSTSTYAVHGMAVTGLNISQGVAVAVNELRRGTGRIIQVATCHSGPSVANLSSLVALRNTWVGSWATY